MTNTSSNWLLVRADSVELKMMTGCLRVVWLLWLLPLDLEPPRRSVSLKLLQHMDERITRLNNDNISAPLRAESSTRVRLTQQAVA
jgi:hypothetical protein